MVYLALRDQRYERGHLHVVDARSGALRLAYGHPGSIDEMHPSPQGLLCVHSRDDDEDPFKRSWLCRFDPEDGLQPLVENVHGIAGQGRWVLSAKRVENGWVTQWAVSKGQPSTGYDEIFSFRGSPQVRRLAA